MERSIRARLGAARMAMAGATGEARATLSRTQAAAVVELVNMDAAFHQLPAERLASIQDLALLVDWEPSDKGKVIASLAPRAPAADSAKNRRASQHMAPALLSYFSEEEWSLLTSDVDWVEKSELVSRRVMQLTGQNVAEPSMKLIASFLMLLSEQSAWNLQGSQKMAALSHFKEDFRRRARKYFKGDPHGGVYVVNLPASPGEFRRLHPEIYAKAFPTGGPVVCKISIAQLQQIDSSFSCRQNGHANFKLATASASVDLTALTARALQQMIAIQDLRMQTTGSNSQLPLQLSDAPAAAKALPGLLPGMARPRGGVPDRFLALPGAGASPARRLADVADVVAGGKDAIAPYRGDAGATVGRGPDAAAGAIADQGAGAIVARRSVAVAGAYLPSPDSAVAPLGLASDIAKELLDAQLAPSVPKLAVDQPLQLAIPQEVATTPFDQAESNVPLFESLPDTDVADDVDITESARDDISGSPRATVSGMLQDFLAMRKMKDSKAKLVMKKPACALSEIAACPSATPIKRSRDSDIDATEHTPAKQARGATNRKGSVCAKKIARTGGGGSDKSKIRVDHEQSRCQFLLRCGLGKGSRNFKYIAGNAASKDEAKAAAESARRELLNAAGH